MSTEDSVLSGSILSVFITYAVPNVLGMLALSSAIIIDGFFLGNYVGSSALAALNMALPLGSLVMGVSLMISVGAMVRCGKYIGEGNQKAASAIFTKAIAAIAVFAVIVLVFGFVFMDGLIALLGANEQLAGIVKTYLQIYLLFTPFLLFGLSFSYFVRIDGRPVVASVALLMSAVVNITLDGLFIAVLDMGVQGAALGTGIAEFAMFLVLIFHFFSSKASLKLVRIKDGWNEIFHAAYNGLSEFSTEASAGVITLIFNWVLINRLGVEGVAAFTIVTYLLFTQMMICYGISEALQPIISKNFGAQNHRRVMQFVVLSGFMVMVTGGLFILILLTTPERIAGLFLKSGEQKAITLAVEFITLFWPALLFNGINVILSAYFTAMQKPAHSVAISLSRSLVMPALFIFTLPLIIGNAGMFLAIPAAELATVIPALYLFYRNRPRQLIEAEYSGTKPDEQVTILPN